NEPHGKNDGQGMAIWDDSTAENNWKYAAERGAAAVLGKNPNLLVMVEGIEVYPKFEEGGTWDSPPVDYSRYPYSDFHGAWWGANFRGAREYPVDLGEHQSQLVYSPHDYGPLVYAQTWFEKDFTTQTLLDDYWYDTWAYLIEENISPLLMGEWGGFIDEQHDPTGDNKKWMQLLRDYMIDKHIHHTFWCFNENSGDTGGLVYDNFGKWDEEKYEFVRPSLWQNESGKFISLDHKIPLGQSGGGISLSDYYNGTEKPETTATETTESDTINFGDANLDGKVTIADATAIIQSLGNSDEYSLSRQGAINADVVDNGDGVTGVDANAIQAIEAGFISQTDFPIDKEVLDAIINN
ncbi:MAG: cellulase family glycosylhydrolase, partial [Ruminococcus sp.]|nr:cellulase family glycosylhydrolase [Ruminococcus sp.]